VGPHLRQLEVNEMRNVGRLPRPWRGCRGLWAQSPSVEPRAHTVAKEYRESETRSLVGATATERDPPQRLVMGDQCSGRHLG
jgi:hypothetical protein